MNGKRYAKPPRPAWERAMSGDAARRGDRREGIE
jgi:hypothetical protein